MSPTDLSDRKDPVPYEPFVERRLAPRKRIGRWGVVVLGNGREPLPCTVVDMSAAGARIELRTYEFIPILDRDDLTLVLVADRVEVDFAIRWGARSEFGVQFRSSFRPTLWRPRPDGLLWHLIEWQGTKRRRRRP